MQVYQRVDQARFGYRAAEMRFDELAAATLEREIAGIARANPAAVDCPADGREAVAEPPVDHRIRPGLHAGRLAVVRREGLLRGSVEQEAGVGESGLRFPARGRDAEPRAADCRPARIGPPDAG